MIDIAVVKAAVGLFKDLLDLIDSRSKNQREMFGRTCKPLYASTSEIAKQYYGILQSASERLEGTVDLSALLADVRKQRANFIIARNEILGQATAFVESYGSEISSGSMGEDFKEQFHLRLAAGPREEQKNLAAFHRRTTHAFSRISANGEFETLAYSFAIAISNYFNGFEFMDTKRNSRPFLRSQLSSFISFLEHAIELERTHPGSDPVPKLRNRARRILETLEKDWTLVAKQYALLKLHCQR